PVRRPGDHEEEEHIPAVGQRHRDVDHRDVDVGAQVQVSRNDRDDHRDYGEEKELPAPGQAERSLVRQLDEVVQESDRTAGESGEEHGQGLESVVADRQEGDRRGEQDEEPAHRRRTLLGHVVLRPLLPDLLPELVAAEEVDEPWPDGDREGEAHGGGDEDTDHAPAPNAFATTSSPTDRDPLTRIASPGQTSPRASSTASAAVGAHSSGA